METSKALIILFIVSGAGTIGGFALLFISRCWIKSVLSPDTVEPARAGGIRSPHLIDIVMQSGRAMILTGCLTIALSFVVAWFGVLLMLWNGRLWFDC